MHGGLGFDHTSLHPWLDPLGEEMHLIYYDHRGNGRSGRPPLETLTFEQFCADADALRAHLGYEKVAVLGYSFGGFIALEYALRYPERLSHLILLDTAPTLILVGRDDFICPPSQAKIMHERIPDSELVVFENSGHFAHVEEPDAFCAAIRAWLKRT
jgi:pimeloyl-ACP methyl ester carboxylesterase